jgi:phenolic acid decarboxylase
LNSYSGKIIIADDLQRRFIGRAFIGANSYNKVYELEIMKGRVIDYKDTSGMYVGF